MNKTRYIYIKGNTFYFLESLPEDGDYVHGSVRACHVKAFGNQAGVPNGYRKHFAVEGLFEKAG